MTLPHRLLSLFCALLLVVGCTRSSLAPPELRRLAKREPRPGFRLGDADPARPEARTTVRGEALDATETAALLARLPALETSPAASAATTTRPATTPPPRPGHVVATGFPPATTAPPAVAPAGAPRIVRRAPEGEVSHAPNVSVTFDRPMIALSGVQELTTKTPPLTLTPQPPGSFRWLGTQTVVFQAEHELPKSTDYVVEVPASTRDLSGVAIDHAERFTFSTPTVQLIAHAPEGNANGVRPLLFAELDQRIDPAQLVGRVQVELEDRPADGTGRSRAVRLASAGEIAADRAMRDRYEAAERAHPGRSLVFVPTQPLPPASSVQVTFPRGLPSLEGPRLTERDQSFHFRTFDKLTLTETTCDPCTPTSTFTARFSTAIDPRTFSTDRVRVEPRPSDLQARVRDGNIELWASWKSLSRYVVEFDESLSDRFGQRLGPGAVRDFTVVPFPPALYQGPRLSAIEPTLSGSTHSVYTTNIMPMRYRLVRIRPEDWRDYLRFERAWNVALRKRDFAALPTPPGTVVVEQELRPDTALDRVVETKIDLKAALVDGVGQVLVIVQPREWPQDAQRDFSQLSWVQVTHLGLGSFEDADGLSLFASKLDGATPLANVTLSLPEIGRSAVSDPRGHTRFAGPIPRLADGATPLVVARQGSDSTFEPNVFGAYGRSGSELRMFTFDDRGIYRPGETVRIKGIVRRVGQLRGGDVAIPKDLIGVPIRYTATDGLGTDIATGDVRLDDGGGVLASFVLKKEVNLGEITVTFDIASARLPHHEQITFERLVLANVTFVVEEFRRPELEVGAEVDPGPHVVGGSAVASARASYYAGGGLRAAETTWRVARSRAAFTPPNRTRWLFGNHEEPSNLQFTRIHGEEPSRDSTSATWRGRTDASGTHRLRVDLDGAGDPYPMSLTLDAEIRDQNQQALAARTTMLVHPADWTVGLRLERPFLQAGDSIPLEIVVTSLDGGLLEGKRVHLRSHRVEGEEIEGRWITHEVDVSECSFVSRNEPVSNACPLPTKGSGRYYVSAEVVDDHGRTSRTSIGFWGLGEGHGRERSAGREGLELALDKTEYAVGEHAELLLKAPFAPAEALLEIVGGATPREERFTLHTASETRTVTILPDDVPGLQLRVTLVGMLPRRDEHGAVDPAAPKLPAAVQASTPLSVPPTRHALKVVATPEKTALRPGETNRVTLALTDASGAPVRAEATIFVIDESILALTGYTIGNPLETFFQPVGSLPGWRDTRTYVAANEIPRRRPFGGTDTFVHPGLTDTSFGFGAAFESDPGTIGHGRLGGAHATPRERAPAPTTSPRPVPPDAPVTGTREPAAPGITLRRDFSALAFYETRVRTDGDGHAEVSFRMPQSTSRFRVIAGASDDHRAFGTGEATITVRQPVTVRPSAPRFLSYGDRFELPVVVQNQSDAPMHVALAARCTNATLAEDTGRSLSVAAGDRVEVRLAAAAAQPGTARFDVVVSASEPGAAEHTDAVHVEVPVWTPGTTEAFATYGTLGDPAEETVAQALALPPGSDPAFGGLELSASSTALFALSDAAIDLTGARYQSNEQLASRVLAIATLRDVAKGLASTLPSRATLDATVAQDLRALASRQSSTGGFGFWDTDHSPVVGVHAALAFATARQKGITVDPTLYDAAKAYLTRIHAYLPAWYPVEARRALRARAVFVLRRMGAPDPALAAQLVQEAGVAQTGLETLALLLPTLNEGADTRVLAAEIGRHVQNHVVETAEAAHFVTDYGDAAYLVLASEHRTDALVLLAMLEKKSLDPLAPKIVAGLLAARTRGHWHDSQEDSLVLLALDAYFRRFEQDVPRFVARTWLGEHLASEHSFRGRSTDRVETFVPMAELAAQEPSALTVQKAGAGRLYYRLGLRCAPSDHHVPALERGFTVSRRYEAISSPTDVTRDDHGVWHVRLGAVVRVRVDMVAPSERHHVALVDPMPAGFEAVNTALLGTPPIVADIDRPRQNDFSPFWYEHENLRDERAEAFTTLLHAGAHSYEYTVRATTAGDFVVAPAKAEEMYAPETFGRAASDRVRIE